MKRIVLSMNVPDQGVNVGVWLESLERWLKAQGIGVQLSGDGIGNAGVALSLSADAPVATSGMTSERRQYVAQSMGITSPPAPKPLSNYPL